MFSWRARKSSSWSSVISPFSISTRPSLRPLFFWAASAVLSCSCEMILCSMSRSRYGSSWDGCGYDMAFPCFRRQMAGGTDTTTHRKHRQAGINSYCKNTPEVNSGLVSHLASAWGHAAVGAVIRSRLFAFGGRTVASAIVRRPYAFTVSKVSPDDSKGIGGGGAAPTCVAGHPAHETGEAQAAGRENRNLLNR